MKELAYEFRAALASDLSLAARILEKHPSLIDHPVFGSSESALHYFATENRAEVARWLLSRGANPNGIATDNSSLHAAALLGHREVCMALIQAGADLDLQDDLGETALHKASSGGHIDVIEALLDAGADPSIVEPCGELPVDQALPRKLDQIRAVFDAHAYLLIAFLAVSGCNGRSTSAGSITSHPTKLSDGTLAIDSGQRGGFEITILPLDLQASWEANAHATKESKIEIEIDGNIRVVVPTVEVLGVRELSNRRHSVVEFVDGKKESSFFVDGTTEPRMVADYYETYGNWIVRQPIGSTFAEQAGGGPTPFLPLSEPLFSPSCAPTVKSNFLAILYLRLRPE